MTINKRNPEFAYLRLNCYDSHSPGLYPSRDFLPNEPNLAGGDQVVWIEGDETKTVKKVVFVEQGADLSLYEYGVTNLIVTINNVSFEAGGIGTDGIRFVDSMNDVYKFDQDTSILTLITNLPDTVTHVVFDGLFYYYILQDGRIFRELPGNPVTQIFAGLPNQVDFADDYRDYIAMASQAGSDVYVYLYDKNNNTLL